jgi:hypothetical protein
VWYPRRSHFSGQFPSEVSHITGLVKCKFIVYSHEEIYTRRAATFSFVLAGAACRLLFPLIHHHWCGCVRFEVIECRPILTMAMAPSLCGGTVSSRRGLLALLWSIVTLLTALAFIIALLFSFSAKNVYYDNDGYYNNNNNNGGAEGQGEEEEDSSSQADPEMAVTSRAMAFAALWTAVLATLLSIFGTVILGWQSPTGEYYTCCSSQVHRTTPLALGSFIGALLMFANLTLVCSVLFGEFEVRRSAKMDFLKSTSCCYRRIRTHNIFCCCLFIFCHNVGSRLSGRRRSKSRVR